MTTTTQTPPTPAPIDVNDRLAGAIDASHAALVAEVFRSVQAMATGIVLKRPVAEHRRIARQAYGAMRKLKAAALGPEEASVFNFTPPITVDADDNWSPMEFVR